MAIVRRARRRTGSFSWRNGLSLPLLLFALLLTGCPAKQNESPLTQRSLKQDRSAGAFAGTDPWRLTTTDRNAHRGNRGIFLGNGYLGATFGPDGGAGPDSVCYVAGVYDEKENLAPIPLWNKLDLPEHLTKGPYSQTLDMKRGVLVTKMDQVTVTALISAVHPFLAVLHVEGAPAPSKLAPPTAPDGRPLTQVANGAFVYRIDGTQTQLLYLIGQKADDRGWARFVMITKLPLIADARVGKDPFSSFTYTKALADHAAAWAKLWKDKDIAIEGDPEAQQLVHSLMFNLLQSARAGGADSIPPETWSGDFYKGHIFWDADVWMFPALLAQHPELARSILDYRFRHLDAAKRRARAAGFKGADFPWESAASGREVAPGGFSEGRHVTAGVGWAHWQYWRATSDRAWLRTRGWPVLSAVADYFASRAKRNAVSGKYEIRRVMGPDENHGLTDNNTYTNALARYCLRAASAAAKIVGRRANPKWAEVAENIVLPYDRANRRYLARDGDKGEKTKQADGELVLYPAALPMDTETARSTFDFHAARPITSGPAMTSSIHALLAARLGRPDAAERYFRDAYRPFVRGPFLQFSEKRSLDRCYFATGAGGVLQSVLYGFGGLDWERFDGTAYPVALPSSWKKLTVTGIRRGGKTYRLEVTPNKRTLTAQ